MKRFLRKRFIWISILVLFSLIIYSLIYYYRDLIFGPPVLFWDDDYIEINLYPCNYNAAVVFTVDDVYKLTEPEKILNITEILDRYSFKGVFFVIPYYKGRYKINKDDPVTKTLIDIEKKGHEIAQHGLTHWVPRRKLLVIKLEKGNELELKNLTVLFKKDIPAKKYRIVNGEGNILKEGKIEESVTIDY
ncbi:MAG: DUF2334 domain-containing protein [Candidatus Omnitrophica bacterium]|nr:DUF2334 domain-containing protein [Candidatus Omnitrophota bacterium]